MRKRAIRADFYLFSIFFQIVRISGAVFFPIHGTITKKAVKRIESLMTGIVFALLIFKKTIGIFHGDEEPFLYKLFRSICFVAFSTKALAKAGFDG